MAPADIPGALSHIRVLDVTSPLSQLCARIFADLGADVVKVEPPGGDAGRQRGPFVGDQPGPERSLSFLYLNRGKRSVVLDLTTENGRDTLRRLAQQADVLVEDYQPGYLAELGLGYEDLRALNPRLVYISITPFGQTGEFSGYRGGDLVAQATGGIMFANGDDTRRPVMVPYELISQIGCLHAAFGGLVALRARRSTGEGQHVDLSRQEVVLYCQGGYIPRYSMQNEIARRERLMPMGGINTYQCGDGSYVNVAPFMAHHFRRLTRDVMRHPVLSDPEWAEATVRRERREEIDRHIAEYVRTVERDTFVEEGQRAGVPIIPTLRAEEFVDHPHTRERGFFREVEQPGVGRYRTAGPPAILSATPWRVDRPAPSVGQHTGEVLGTVAARQAEATRHSASDSQVFGTEDGRAALGDLRVVDFTRAFAGPLATMFLGFFGAEVVKIESAELEDNRQPGQPTFPELNRTKLSCCIDTRTPEGKVLVKKLVQQNGVVVENFRPGVMERLNLSYDELRSVRPDLIMLSMPGFGNSGPLRSYYSYGQQVMGMTGLTHLWGHAESPLDARVKYAFPDYVAAITGALVLLAALEHRDMTGQGQYIELSQVEALAHLLSVAYMEYTEIGRPPQARGNWSATAAPHDVYPCLGFDAWCAIEVRSEEEWQALFRALGKPDWAREERFQTLEGRIQHKEELDRLVGEWTSSKTPRLATKILQQAGVPAGIVASAEDLYHDVHLRQRGMIVKVHHPDVGLIEHAGINVHLSATPGHADRPAPSKGEHNDYVFTQLLGMSDEERSRLEATGALR